ncbi:hypothetical protein CRM22_009149 [Opisthorchis felineus]|uniref:MD-2-related lipid-recognition domain-containing protein n=1 Tax=Opisthorchis felineus TaxID=147828 RepID=A0A4S2L7X8_OPIFE|nr:hypothetical protein CRM22_009149 [Opisthorchis felineus]
MQLSSIVISGMILNLSNLAYAISFRDCGSPGASVTTFSIIPCHSLPCVLTKGHEFTVLFTFTATTQAWYPRDFTQAAQLSSGNY